MIYLDNAATSGKKPLSVYYAIVREMVRSANAGRSGHRRSMNLALKIEDTRAIIREHFFDGEVIFTKNCTEALNLAFTCIPKGKKVIASTSNHNSVLRPLKRSEKENPVFFVDSEEIPRIMAAEKNNIGMVVLCGVSNVTGKREDVEKIAETVKKYSNAVIVLDGAQSAGKVDFDYGKVDIFCASGHKSLYGVQGTGFLLMKKSIRLRPIITGGTGTSSLDIGIQNEVPEGLEAGTVNGPGIVALYYGMKYAFTKGRKIFEREKRLGERLCQKLRQENIKIISCENGIVLCNMDGISSVEVSDILSEKYGICVRGGLHCAPLIHKKLLTAPSGAIRISFGKGNTLRDVYKVGQAFKEIKREQEQSE